MAERRVMERVVLGALAALGCLLGAAEAQAQDGGSAEGPEGLAALWEAPAVVSLGLPGGRLEDVVGGWSSLAGLAGPCEVSGEVRPDREGKLVERLRLWSGAARAGTLALGALEVRLERRLDAAESQVTVRLVGPLAEEVRADLQLPVQVEPSTGALRFSPGSLGGRAVVSGLDLGRVSQGWAVLALEGRVDADVSLGGTVAAPVMDASLFAKGVRWRGEEVGVLAARWMHSGEESEVEARWGTAEAPHAAVHLTLPVQVALEQLDARWLDDRPLTFWLVAREVTPKLLRPFWRAPTAADFTVDVVADGAGPIHALRGKAEVTGTLKDRDQAPLPVRATVEIGPKEQVARLALGASLLSAEVTTGIDLAGVRRRGMQLEGASVAGRAALALPMEVLGPYAPELLYDPRGQIDGRLEVLGTLGAPRFKGQVTTEQAAMTVVGLKQRLREVRAAVDIDGDTATLRTLEAKVGLGRVEGSGQVRLEVTPEGVDPAKADLWSAWRLTAGLELELERFPFLHETLPGGALEGKARLDATLRPTTAEVRVGVREGRLRMTEARLPPAQAIPTNVAIHRIDWRGEEKPSGSIFAGAGRLRVEVVLEEPIQIEGGDTALTVRGRLLVERQDAEARTEGGFEVAPGGTFQIFAAPFTVLSGGLTLPGGSLRDPVAGSGGDDGGPVGLFDPDRPAVALPLEPTLNFTARGFAVDTHILMKVQGPVRRPELILASSPPLPEYQILTLLITGRVDAVDDRNGDVRRQVAALVSRFHAPSLSKQLYDRLGVDKIGLGFGASIAQPILTVGKQINRQLYVESVYHHDAPPEANGKEGHVEYRLDPFWTVDTVYGDAAVGSLGVFWQASFGGPTPPAPPEDWGLDEDGGGVEREPPAAGGSSPGPPLP